ncbi:MAG TPA: 3-keto-5-aminohexanoate cleavage protein [Thermoleophilaceae bacterium]|nr:3-keto-5-aminohexanoate cleavage protein [Thermoleophilaceae bacterium]
MLQACLNGQRARADHPAVPLTPDELAADARRAVAAGAAELHVHPRVPGGARDTVEPGPAAATVRAIRTACPGVPLGLTTGLWTTDGDADRRHASVAAWEELPDYVSVNLFEPGSAELCALLERRGVGIEAGVWTLDDARLLLERGLSPLRVLVETSDGGAEDPVAAAAEIDELLVRGGLDAPQLHHGAGAEAWPVLDAALARGHDVRIGLEDTTLMPDGSTARDNAELVAEAARRVGS